MDVDLDGLHICINSDVNGRSSQGQEDKHEHVDINVCVAQDHRYWWSRMTLEMSLPQTKLSRNPIRLDLCHRPVSNEFLE